MKEIKTLWLLWLLFAMFSAQVTYVIDNLILDTLPDINNQTGTSSSHYVSKRTFTFYTAGINAN